MTFQREDIMKLNETEAKLYLYIIENWETVKNMNIRDLAATTFVSTATIQRFCQKLNCSGYAEFKEKMNSMARSPKGAIEYRVQRLKEELDRMAEPAYAEGVLKFAERLHQMDTITFIGIGNSAPIAAYAARYFSNLGYYSFYIADSFYPPQPRATKKNAVIAISISGETPELITQLKLYKDFGASVFALTAEKDSTITKIADAWLAVEPVRLMTLQTYEITSFSSMVFLIEQIGYYLTKKENRMYEIGPYTIMNRFPESEY